jgi:glyoxylase-like metal-dependent hydrolase (beta-lactamase superfamily II)
MQLGDFELVALSDGFFRLDGGAMFGVVPKVLWQRRAPADDRNRIRLGLRPLLIRAGATTLLVDAGIGDKMSAKDADMFGLERTTTLDRSLRAAGVTCDDIDIVIASHLHLDHAGGFTVRDGDVVRPRFPRARYVVRRGEWDDATHPHERNRASYIADDFRPLERAGQLDLVDDDGDVVPGIALVRTGGHCQHHQMIRVTSGGRTAVFAADLIPTVAHIDNPWIMGYDLYPMDTLHFKQAFIREAIEREYVIFFEHDPTIEAGIIREVAGRRSVEEVRP